MNNEEWKEAARINAEKLESEIDSLKSEHINFFKKDYKGFWEHVRQIRDLFKTLKPLANEERQKLWDKYGSICDEVKRKAEDEKHKAEAQSKGKTSGIKSEIQRAYYLAKAANTRDELNEAKEILQKVMGMMKDGWGAYNVATDIVASITGDEGKLSKEDREYCWEKWKEANEAINYRWKDLSTHNYNELSRNAWSALNEANSGDPYEAQKMVKEVQCEMKGKILSRENREEIFNTLDKAWQTASDKIKERKEESARKQEAWKDKMHDTLARFEGFIGEKENLIERIKSQIDELEDRVANARTEEDADKFRGWIQEKYDFINNLSGQIRELEEKISSIKDKLNN